MKQNFSLKLSRIGRCRAVKFINTSMTSIQDNELFSHDVSLSDNHERQLYYRRWTIAPVIFLYIIGGQMTSYIVPEYIQGVIKREYAANESIYNGTCFEDINERLINDRVQSESAHWSIYLSLSNFLPAILSNLVLVSYSDIIGRKRLLIVNLTGILVRIVANCIIVKLKLDFFYFTIANVIEGITGSFTTLVALSCSYISDLTSAGNQRTLFIVLFKLVLDLSITISNFVIGYFIKITGFFYPALTGALVTLIGEIIAVMALPETLEFRSEYSPNGRSDLGEDKSSSTLNKRGAPPSTKDTLNCSAVNKIDTSNKMKDISSDRTISCATVFHTLNNIWTLYFRQEDKVKSVKYVLLLLAFMFTCIPEYSSIDTLYQLGSPFCWSSTKIGWYAALKTGLATTVGLLAAYGLKKLVDADIVAAVGVTSIMSAWVVEAFAKTSTVFFMVPVIGFMGSLPMPLIRGLMSEMTGPNLQGALFACMGSVETFCILLGSLTTYSVYAATLTIMNGFVYLISATYAFIALSLIVAFAILKRRTEDGSTLLIEEDSD